jgi:hypothetical protein
VGISKTNAADIGLAKEVGLSSSSQFALRTIIRTTSAYVEGTVYQLRLVCLASVEDVPNIFSPEEVLALKEVSISLDRKGKIQSKDSYQKILQSILFTFSCFAKLHGVSFIPDKSDNGWSSLQNFFNIRNSLMHPKSRLDFEIDGEKNQTCVDALQWFQDNLKQLFRTCEEADKVAKEHETIT